MGQDRRDEPLTELLVSVYESVVAEMRADRLVQPHLEFDDPVYVIAVGKAALAMASMVRNVAAGIVVCPVASASLPGFEVLEGDHPVPGPRSLKAGERVMEFARGVPRGARVVGLLSGGASALMEVLDERRKSEDKQARNEAHSPFRHWTLEAFQAETKRLMRQGLSIHDLNAFRRSASLVKGGGLGKLLEGCDTTIYVLSDVWRSDFAVIGSGPFWLGEKGPKHVLVGDAHAALEAAVMRLSSLGFRVVRRPWIGGEARIEGVNFGRRAVYLSPGEAIVAVGEPRVTVRGDGVGGRAQEFAMGASRMIAGCSGVAVLAAGTDGRDGPSEAAGAVVDGGSWDSQSMGELERSDSFSWGVRRGVGIPRWETGTNVNDLFLAVRR